MKKAVSCAQCGTKMRAGIKFCSKCGYRLKDAEAEARAEAAQAEEAAANFLTEEEVAALRAAEATPVAEEVAVPAAPAAPAVPEEAAPSPKLLKLQERTEASKKKYADAKAGALYKQRAAAEKDLAKRGAKVDSRVARVEAVVDSERRRSEEISRFEAAKRERMMAVAETKVARKNAAAEKKLSSMKVDENKRAAKLAAAADKKNFKDSLVLDRRDAERAEREDRKAIASRAFEGQIANLRQNSEHALSKKQDKETLNLEKKAIAGKEKDLREKIKGDRSLVKALRAEEKKEAKLRRTEANAAIYDKKAENRLLKERVEKERVQQKHRVSSDEKLQSTRLNSEFKTAKKLSVERMKQTRELLKEEAKAAGRDNRELKKQVEEKAFDNRLQERQEAIDRKIRKRREADKRRVAEKQASVRQKATKKIGAIEYKAASVSMTAETSEARRQAMIAERDMKCMLKEEKLKKREVEEETKLINQRINADERILNVRTGGEKKNAKKLAGQRMKQTRALLNEEAKLSARQAVELKTAVQEKAFDNRLYAKQLSSKMKIRKRRESDLARAAAKTAAIEARETKRLGAMEYKTATIGLTPEVIELRRKTDLVDLDTKRRIKENKLYAQKLAAEKRINERELVNARKNQQLELKGLRDKSEAKRLGDNRTVRIGQDEARRALNKEKNQDYLYNRKLSLDENIDKREHKLALRAAKVEEENSKRLIARKEKEQKKNLRMAERYRKDALRRAKKISKISGVPVSQVPALMGESAPSALLTSGAVQDTGVPGLREPDALLKTSYANSAEQYEEYKQRKKAEKKRLRYVEIGVRNDKKYFSSIYEKGEVMVAKRTVRVARIQAVLAIVLMVFALVACFQPFYTIDTSHYSYFPVAIKDTILDGTGELSFKSLVTDSSGSDLVTSIVNGINSYLIALPQAFEQDSFLSYLGTWAVVGFMALALALTPIIIVANLLIAVIRLIFRGFGHSVAITRVMKNLRASYTFLGFTMLPALVLPQATMASGFLLYIGSFAAALVLMFLLNFIKKYEKGDKKYRRSVRFGGFLRLILLVAFLFIFGTSGVFRISGAGNERTMMLASFACLGIAYIIVGFASRAVTSLGFEFIGYTKGRSLSHTALIVFGSLASILAFMPTILVPGHFDANVSLVIAGVVVMLAFLVFTLLGGFVRSIIAKRYNLIDPIINAISEGYPLK